MKQFIVLAVVGVIVVAATVAEGLRTAGTKGGGAAGFVLDTRPYFFSLAENKLFGVLTQACASLDLLVFPKVGLNDIFKDRPGAERGQYNRYAQMHVDYLLVTRQDYRPVAGIELDGASHQGNKQQARDAKKNQVFQAAALPLVRLKHHEAGTPQALEDLLRERLGKTVH